MRALVLTDIEQLEVADVPEPEPGDRALVAIERVGICGTDLKIFHGKPPVAYPRVLGHEVVGTVSRPAANGQIPTGTRVLIDPAIACGRCGACRRGRPNLCPNGALMGREIDGGFAEYLAVDDERLLPIPQSVSLQDAGLLQVLGVCVRAQSLVQVFPGDTAVVIGLGVGGLLHTQLLRARGVNRILGITRSADKRRLAEELGASITCHPDDAEAGIDELTRAGGADLVVESVGKVETLAQSIHLAGPGGTVLAYGSIHAEEGRLPFNDLYMKELRIVGSRAALLRDYAVSIDLVASGAVDVGRLISLTLPLEQGPEAFRAIESSSELVKVALQVS